MYLFNSISAVLTPTGSGCTPEGADLGGGAVVQLHPPSTVQVACREAPAPRGPGAWAPCGIQGAPGALAWCGTPGASCREMARNGGIAWYHHCPWLSLAHYAATHRSPSWSGEEVALPTPRVSWDNSSGGSSLGPPYLHPEENPGLERGREVWGGEKENPRIIISIVHTRKMSRNEI